jgi:hypothetical protein
MPPRLIELKHLTCCSRCERSGSKEIRGFSCFQLGDFLMEDECRVTIVSFGMGLGTRAFLATVLFVAAAWVTLR